MKLIDHFVELHDLRKKMDASISERQEKSALDETGPVNEMEQEKENMPKLTDAEYHAHTLDNYPYCLNCQTDSPDRCDCVMNARPDGPFDIDECLYFNEEIL